MTALGNAGSALAVARGGAVAWQLGRLGARLLLLVWAATMLLVGAILLASHWLALPAPAVDDPLLQRALAQLDDRGRGRWQLVHVLYSECRCSQRTLDYLASRPTPEGAVERLLLVGHDEERASKARSRGLWVEEISADELEQRFHIESVPLLVIVDPTGVLRYVGGYTLRQQGLDYQDLEILTQLRQNHATHSLPIYGCAVSRQLQSYLDPIGVKYRR
jgi:hypothetical protein